MAKKKQTSKLKVLERKISLSYLQLIIFALIFGSIGVYFVLQSSAAPNRGKNATTGTASVWIKPLNGADANNMKYNDSFVPGFSLTNITIDTRKASLAALAECWAKSDGSTIIGTNSTEPYVVGQPIWSSWHSLDPKTGGSIVEGSYLKLNGGLTQIWVGGGADCTLSLKKLEGTVTRGTYSQQTTLATHSFSVAP